ncbi:uncharacterized protein FPRO_14318 [Fusarium proliferatum ET1]|uniref:Uncharacterized protein n=1 Tax=Fusarium proliferatum (strain ET1) TaxID=1227346 RepID=A0A1L7VVU5_FUSPR|nr:uncharacterized protein FPRO_14318 [Fusarium proliferatum ET1]CZR44565.1 uncharacterized protein FPRO_14318 [Fusarium proliferatum ET1]
MDPPVRGTRLVLGKKSFLDLAPELQSMIMEFLILSICPLTVPCDAKTKYGPITSAGEQSLLNLKLSCRMIYNAIKEKRFVEAFTIVQPQPHRREWHPSQGAIIFPSSRKAFTIDPFRDMLRVWDMKLPQFQPLSDNILVGRILSVWCDKPIHQCSSKFDRADYPGDSLQLWRQKLQGRTNPDEPRTRRPDHELSDQDHLIPDLCLGKLAFLRELYIVAKKVPNPPTNDIVAGQHIGEVWNNGATFPPPGPNEYLCPTSGAMVSFESPARPLVGLYGYDKTETTRGGFWAGFLYYQLKKEVWFSPLSALEVRDATTVPVADKPERKLFEGTHSDFVARVWIIRGDQDLPPAQPHHRWVKVKSDQPGDPRYTGEIELMWSIVVDRVLGQTQGETPYELRVHREWHA